RAQTARPMRRAALCSAKRRAPEILKTLRIPAEPTATAKAPKATAAIQNNVLTKSDRPIF
ncbi:MAG: hypothetical protein RR825_07795, partial [Ruthenibacterium sp.]